MMSRVALFLLFEMTHTTKRERREKEKKNLFVA